MREEIIEVNKRCEQQDQDLKRTREEVDGKIDTMEEVTEARIESLKRLNQDEIKRVRIDVGERCEEVSTSVDAVRNLTVANRERIEELRQQEIVQMREEIEVIRNRPIQGQYLLPNDNRDVINFKNYRRNPIEFLARIEEHLTRITETRWNNIRSLIDEYFKEIYDNWWTATRHEVNSYEEFKAQFLSLIHI